VLLLRLAHNDESGPLLSVRVVFRCCYVSVVINQDDCLLPPPNDVRRSNAALDSIQVIDSCHVSKTSPLQLNGSLMMISVAQAQLLEKFLMSINLMLPLAFRFRVSLAQQ